MTEFLTPERVARRTSTALDTAVGAGRDLGLVPKLPLLAQYLNPAVDQWRDTPFAVNPHGLAD